MITVYHGSPSLFDKFDHSKIGSSHATSEGYGFYFTDIKQIAHAYASDTKTGYLYTVNLDIKKSLSPEKLTITRSQLKRFIEALHKHDNLYFLSNYGDIDHEGYNKVLNEAVNNNYDYNDNDVDLIASICNVYGSKEPLQVLYNTLGYDHIKMVAEWNHNLDTDNTLYIALVNDIIEIEKVEKIKECLQ